MKVLMKYFSIMELDISSLQKSFKDYLKLTQIPGEILTSWLCIMAIKIKI